MTTIKIPKSIEEVMTELGELGELLTAGGWKRAALLATVVRLPGSGGRKDRAAKRDTAFCSCDEFASLDIKGLRSANTVRLYVQRWLDANDGQYPTLGDRVTQPADDWPPEERSLGSRVSVDPARAVEQIVEKHGPEAVASAVVDNEKVNAAVSRKRLDKVSTPKGRKELVDNSRRSAEALEEAVRGSHAALADHTPHEVELPMMAAESELGRAVVKQEQYPYVSESQEERIMASCDRIESYIGILRKGVARMTEDDRKFLAAAGIEL